MVRLRARATAVRVLAVVALAAAALVTVASPASADSSYAEGFESFPEIQWEITGSGGGTGHIYHGDCGLARTGCSGVILSQTRAGFEAVGRRLTVAAPATDLCWLTGR